MIYFGCVVSILFGLYLLVATIAAIVVSNAFCSNDAKSPFLLFPVTIGVLLIWWGIASLPLKVVAL